MITHMLWLALVGIWLLVVPAGAVVLARVCSFGDRPSTPWDAWDVEASGEPRATAVATEPVPTH